ncbi:hypothetical protein [Deinococcus maricopensis]|uniref:PepSY domain-containing protein n=1 Tax=Deinococcus maricopensis (strain DSM 21211 / LMG 22137 / NRRL B-23946 / LB-34) TaxID=709986 RepID=E8U8P8_DEIML|nr:hypothetical protein [Deinococcus maricopensis]ADV67437.1 hypothetical protein Deima_1789 [Deinococcus maricopensis DSM 21211]
MRPLMLLTTLGTLALAVPAHAQSLGLTACQSACGFRLGSTLTPTPPLAQQTALTNATRVLQADGFMLSNEHTDALGNRTQVWHNPREDRWARVDITRSGQVAVERRDTPPTS